VADFADADLLLPLNQFLTADSCAVVNSTAVQTTGTLVCLTLSGFKTLTEFYNYTW